MKQICNLSKIFSEATVFSQEIVTLSPDKLQLEDTLGYITVEYDGLAYVMDKNQELDDIKVIFLHPSGPHHHLLIQGSLICYGYPS